MSKVTLNAGQRRRKISAVIGHLAALETTPRIEAENLRAKARDAILDEMAENLILLQTSDKPDERKKLSDANHDLNRSLKRLVAKQIKEINETPAIKEALKDLSQITQDLAKEAKKTKS